jgi:hypothetical protein
MSRRQPDLRKLGRRQRGILWLILAGIVLYGMQLLVLDSAFGLGGDFEVVMLVFLTLVQIALTIGTAVYVALILSALGVHPVWIVLWTVLAIAPCANLLILVFMNAAATRELRKAGLQVRFMGVDPEELQRVLDPNLCNTCGYDLTGNISGICPECGRPVPPMATPLDRSAPVADS